MKKRIAYISLYFFTVLLIFILQKPLFMLYNGAIEKGFGFTDFLHVMIHGAGLDAAMTGYLTAFPFLLILISIWFRRFPLKKILWGYYAFVATLVSVIFVADMGLYPSGALNWMPLFSFILILPKRLWQVFRLVSSCCGCWR